MKRLTEVNNDKATKLYRELLEEIKAVEEEQDLHLLNSNGYVRDFIGTYKSTRSYGNCYHSNGTFTITLNEDLVSKGTDFQIKEVLVHEIIHTLPNCFNHKYFFKCKSRLFKRLLGYDAEHNSYGLLKSTRKEKAKYKVTCKGCGKTYYFMRKCKQTEHAPYWHCTTCGNSFVVEQLR